MLTPSPAEGYSLSISSEGLNTTDIPYQTHSVEFLKPPKQANSEYPQNINKQKLPVSDGETSSFLLWNRRFKFNGCG